MKFVCFFRLGKLLLQKERMAPTDIGWTVDNALIECFAVHFRALSDFFYSSRTKPDDVLAEQFLANDGEWGTFRRPLPEQLQKCRTRVNKEVVHITGIRFYGTDPIKPWPIVDMINELKAVVILFAEKASKERLHERVRVFAESLEEFMANGPRLSLFAKALESSSRVS